MASGAARAVRNRGAKRVGFAPTVVVPTARAHGVNMMSVATAHEPPRGAAPFAAGRGEQRAFEGSGTVWNGACDQCHGGPGPISEL